MKKKPYNLAKKNTKIYYIALFIFIALALIAVIMLVGASEEFKNSVIISSIVYMVFFSIVFSLLILEIKDHNNAAKLYQLCLKNGEHGEAVIINLHSSQSDNPSTYSDMYLGQ